MKYLVSVVAALGFAAFTVPALAHSRQIPNISLEPLHVFAISTRAGCDAPASIDGNPFFEMPTIAAEQGVSGVSLVRIDLTSAGSLASERLYSSSGNRWLDAAALLSARMTRYTSETANCRHIAGSYIYEVDF